MSTLKKYRKVGGGALRIKIDGRPKIIKPNEIFEARWEDIPIAFQKSLVEIEGIKRTTRTKAITEPLVEEQVTDGELPEDCPYTLASLGTGWWNVEDSEGKVVNESRLRKAAAMAKIFELIAE